jgi:hypothetical protein
MIASGERNKMFSFNAHQRRLSIKHDKNGAFSVTISRNNNANTYIFMLILCTGIFVWFASLFVSGLMRRPLSSDALYVLLFAAFIALWYSIALRVSLWRSFGTEEVIVEDGKLRWTRKALFWVRRLEIPTQGITGVDAVTPWHALSNRVEVTALGRRQKIGDMLLRDEAMELAQRLRHAIGLAQ